MRLKTAAAVNGTIGLRLEGDLGGRAALRTNGVIHHTLPAGGVLARLTACLAAGGLVLQALLRIKLLLTGGEGELSTAILANQYLVFKHFG